MKTPVILDTDIGTDIDDVYALILCAISPELDLKAVTTVNNDTLLRARLAKAVLRLLDRDDIPVAAGEGKSLTPGETRGWMGHEGDGMDLTGINAVDLDTIDGPTRIARTASENPGTTLITIGALTNAALAIERYPDDVRSLNRIVSMVGDFRGFGLESASPEHNAACDPIALQRVIDSGIPLTLIGLNVTQQTSMSRVQVDRIARSGHPLAAELTAMHYIWLDRIGRDASPMHDALAVIECFQPDVITREPVEASLLRDTRPGAILFNRPRSEQVTHCEVAASVRRELFSAIFEDRIGKTLGCDLAVG